MSQRGVLYQWTVVVAKRFETLTLPQAKALAAFSLGLGLAQRCALSAVAGKLYSVGNVETVERRLRRFIGNSNLELAGCCQMLSRWALGSLKVKGPLVLLVDETSLQEHLKVMVVALAYRGKAIPLAWRCYRQDEWPAGQVQLITDLFRWVGEGVPEGKTVLVEADRGIGNSPQLLEAIEAMGWHYLVRVTKGVHLILEEGGETEYGSLVTRAGETWGGEVHAFKKAGWRRCWALAKWGRGHKEPWLLLTNYPKASAEWYGIRMWEELAFKGLKSNGCQWQRSRVREPERAERLWLVMAVAYLWVVSMGTHVLETPSHLARLSRVKGNRLGVFKLGLHFLDRWMGSGGGRIRQLKLIPDPASLTEKSVRQ